MPAVRLVLQRPDTVKPAVAAHSRISAAVGSPEARLALLVADRRVFGCAKGTLGSDVSGGGNEFDEGLSERRAVLVV
jgi:hypothetical protein